MYEYERQCITGSIPIQGVERRIEVEGIEVLITGSAWRQHASWCLWKWVAMPLSGEGGSTGTKKGRFVCIVSVAMASDDTNMGTLPDSPLAEPPILTLERHADDHLGLWPIGGAGQCTDEILQTARDPYLVSPKG